MEFLVIPGFSLNQLARLNRCDAASENFEAWLAGWHGRIMTKLRVRVKLAVIFCEPRTIFLQYRFAMPLLVTDKKLPLAPPRFIHAARANNGSFEVNRRTDRTPQVPQPVAFFLVSGDIR